MATTPMYVDEGRGSSAHVFLRTVVDRVDLLTVSVLAISSIFSFNVSGEKCWNKTQLLSAEKIEN